MRNAIKKYVPILLLSTVIVSCLNYFHYQAVIQISQAQAGTIPKSLILEIIAITAFHLIALSALPLALSAKNSPLTAYIALIILGGFYITYMTGMNAAGPAITIIVFGYLIFYGYSKAKSIYSYYRSK